MTVQEFAGYIYYTYWTAKIFSAPLINTWFEVTDHSQLNFHPIWFPGTTVFQLPVNVAGDPHYKDEAYFGSSSFCVEVDGEQKSLVTYKIPRSYYPWVKSFTPNEAKESTMRMQIQKSLIHSDDLSTEIRLVYQWFAKKPRVWIRVPFRRSKAPRLTTADLVPTCAKSKNTNTEDILAAKLKRAKAAKKCTRKAGAA